MSLLFSFPSYGAYRFVVSFACSGQFKKRGLLARSGDLLPDFLACSSIDILEPVTIIASHSGRSNRNLPRYMYPTCLRRLLPHGA